MRVHAATGRWANGPSVAEARPHLNRPPRLLRPKQTPDCGELNVLLRTLLEGLLEGVHRQHVRGGRASRGAVPAHTSVARTFLALEVIADLREY